MIYEMRTYESALGKLRLLIDRFAKTTDDLFRRYGFRRVGYWTESIGDNSLLHYLLAREDDAERVSKWAEFRDDPDRAVAFAESERDGPLVLKITNRIWIPTNFSALR